MGLRLVLVVVLVGGRWECSRLLVLTDWSWECSRVKRSRGDGEVKGVELALFYTHVVHRSFVGSSSIIIVATNSLMSDRW